MGEMKISNEARARVLNDALPYIQKYHDKIVVIKYGGNAMTNETLKQAVMSDIVLLTLVGVKVVLVHGGGPEINEMLGKLGIESKFIGGLRYTDAATIDVVKMVLAGKVNKELVSALQEKLPQFMVPGRTLRLDEMPLNKNGKIDRNALSAM